MAPLQFGAFRIALGLYLVVYFARLTPYAEELLSRAGMVPDVTTNIGHVPFPNLLAWADSPAAVRLFVVVMAVIAACLTLGCARRVAAVALWYAIACVTQRNELIADPATPFLGWLLLATTLVPPGEPLTLRNRSRTPRPGWEFPARLVFAAWIVVGVSYTTSGALKLGSPAWREGWAFGLFLENTLHRDGVGWRLLHALPSSILAVISWLGLGAELLAGPLALWRRTRPIAWLGLVGMHLVILATMRTTMLSVGALLPLAFTFDARWLVPRAPAGAARDRAARRRDTARVAV